MRGKQGFTLLELMVVIALIAILAALAVPNVVAWRNGAQVNAAAREALSILQYTRSRAIKEATRAMVTFNAGNGPAYTVFIDTDEDDVCETQIRQGRLPGTVTIATGQSFTFTSRGLSLSSGTVDLSGAGKNLSVAVSIAGSVQIG